MKLRTIWTTPAMTFRERLHRTSEWAAIKIAWALPKRVLYWAAMRAAFLVEPNNNPGGVTLDMMMNKIGND